MTLEKSQLYQEIHQQPEVIARLLEREEGNLLALAAAAIRQEVVYVMIAARGTSDNAGRYAKYLLGTMNSLPVSMATPSLFTVYERPVRLGRALVLAISQSGQSPDIVAVLAEARRQGCLTTALTNTPDSALVGEADFVVDLGAGPELAVPATKTYTAELAAIALLSAALAGDREMQREIMALPEKVAAALTTGPAVAAIAPRYRFLQHAVVIGRGYNYATAFEMALKLKELTYAVIEPYSSADFLHGPLAMVEQDFPVIVIAPSGRMLPEMRALAATLRQAQADVMAISDDEAMLESVAVPLRLPNPGPEWLSPIPTIVPGQLLAMHVAHGRGYDVDAPRGIYKITETH